MERWFIYVKCFDGTTGYFTGIIKTATGQEVGVHPYKAKAYCFSDKKTASSTAYTIKHTFPCILSYSIVN